MEQAASRNVESNEIQSADVTTGFELQRIKFLADADKNLSSASTSIRASISSEGCLWMEERSLLKSAIKYFDDAEKGYDKLLKFMIQHGKKHQIEDENGTFFRQKDITEVSTKINSEIVNAKSRSAS